MRSSGAAQELGRRRRRADEMMDRGEATAAVARILGVCRTSPYRWRAMARSSPDGLAACPHPVPMRRPTDNQLKRLEDLMMKEGARAHGWRIRPWAATRVAEPIGRRLAIRSHPEHVRKILKRRLRRAGQEPRRKARERDEVAVAHRKCQAPPGIIRESRRREAYLGLIDESGSISRRRSAARCRSASPEKQAPGRRVPLPPGRRVGTNVRRPGP
jgi:transposase